MTASVAVLDEDESEPVSGPWDAAHLTSFEEEMYTQARRGEHPQGMTCPDCGRPQLWRSRRKGFFERMVSLITGRFPFRCHACGIRITRWIPPEKR